MRNLLNSLFKQKKPAVKSESPYPWGYSTKATYIVKCINPNSGCDESVSIEACSSDEAAFEAEFMGFLRPIEVLCEPEFIAPTKEQLSYAFDVGIEIPIGAGFADVSALITRNKKEDYESPNKEFLEYAVECDYTFSLLIGKNELYFLTYEKADDREKAALIYYCVFCKDASVPIGNLRTSIQMSDCYRFADATVSDEKLLNAIRNFDGSSLENINTDSYVYEAAHSFKNQNK